MKKNKDVFAWLYKDILGVDLEEANHCLNLDITYPPVKQKRRKFALERNKIVND